jgi:hypothetical protein
MEVKSVNLKVPKTGKEEGKGTVDAKTHLDRSSKF